MWGFGKRREWSWVWERELAVECEAFLAGHYARLLNDDHRPVPEWAWLNALAHGGEEDVRAFANDGSCSYAAEWNHALAFLAQEVLSEATRRRCTLFDLQSSTLVPLEFELAARCTQTDAWPTHVVGTVLTALAEHPTNRRS